MVRSKRNPDDPVETLKQNPNAHRDNTRIKTEHHEENSLNINSGSNDEDIERSELKEKEISTPLDGGHEYVQSGRVSDLEKGESDSAKETLSQMYSLRKKLFEVMNTNIHSIKKKASISHPMETQLSKVIAIILEHKECRVTEDFFFLLTNLVQVYFDHIISSLHKLTEIQRRHLPSISDLDLCLRFSKLTPSTLYGEYENSKTLSSKEDDSIKLLKQQTDTLNTTFHDDGRNEKDRSSSVFFTNEYYEITEPVPKELPKPSYVPSYMPDLPPDYTYKATPWYATSIDDLKKVRLKLVEESRLTEIPLYNLMEDEERKWKDEVGKQSPLFLGSEDESSDNVESIMSNHQVDENKASNAGTPVYNFADQTTEAAIHEPESQPKLSLQPASLSAVNGNVDTERQTAGESKSFDIVAYAKRRAQLRKRVTMHNKKKEDRRKNNIYLKAERYYSPYAHEVATEEVNIYFHKIVQEEFTSALNAVRKAEKQNRKKREALKRERDERNKQKEASREIFEFGMHYGNEDNLLGSDSDESASELRSQQIQFDGDLDSENSPKNKEVLPSSELRISSSEHSEAVRDTIPEAGMIAEDNVQEKSDLEDDLTALMAEFSDEDD